MFRRRNVLAGLLTAALAAPLARMFADRSPAIRERDTGRPEIVHKDGWILRRDDLL